MSLLISIAFAVAGSIVVGFSLRAIFRSLEPSSIKQYRACKGGWWEEKLNHCESGLVMLPQQPVNTYTNIAYLTGGAFLMFYLNTFPSMVFFITSLYLCAGSALYHATSTRWAGSLDVSAMYAMFSGLAAYSILKLIGLEDSLAALVIFVAAILMGYLLRYKYKGNVHLKIGIFLGLTYVFLIWSMLRNNMSLLDGYLISSFALFVIAFTIWQLDKGRIFPIKRWGHGLWHLLTAVAISMLFYTIYLIK